MHERKMYTGQAIGFAFNSLLEHVRLFVIVLLVGTGLISLVVGIIAFLNKGFIQAIVSSQALKDYQECVGYDCVGVASQSGAYFMSIVSNNFVALLISAVVLALFFVGLDLGFKRIALQLYDNNRSSYKELISAFALAPKALISWILYCAMVWVGWLLFILPGFIALLCFAFFPYFILDKHAGPIHALKMSYEVTKPHIWDMFAFWVAIKIIVSLGFVSWISVIITWPVSTLAYAYLYRKFVASEHKSHAH